MLAKPEVDCHAVLQKIVDIDALSFQVKTHRIYFMRFGGEFVSFGT